MSRAFQPLFSARRSVFSAPRFVTSNAFISEDEMYSDFPTDEERYDATMNFNEVNDEDSNSIQLPTMDFDNFAPALKVSPEDLVEADQAAMAAKHAFSSKELLLRETKGRKVRASVRETGYDSMRTYIKTMCNHELLNKNEEIVLAREIQILIKWEESREELEELLMRYVACG